MNPRRITKKVTNMYVQSYKWNIACTSKELSVLRKACLIAAGDESLPDLTDEEAHEADKLARIMGGVFAANRAKQQGRHQNRGAQDYQANEGGGDDFGSDGDGEDEGSDGHQHSVPTGNGARQGQRA